MKIAVLLTCHNRKVKTIACLESIFQASLPESAGLELFLVDDGSTDGTGDIVKEHFPQVHVIAGTGDLFWNGGMHLAWKKAIESKIEFDFFLWLNDDTIVYHNAISKMIQISTDFNNQVNIVGSTCSPINKSEITYGGWKKKEGLLAPGEKPIECDFFNGNLVLIPRFVFNQIGMNDIKFRHALGDLDYGLRAKKAGIKNYIANGILGECEPHESFATWCNPKINLKQRLRVFRTPLGQNPEEFFVFELRHNGIIMAFLHYLTNHLRLLFPQLWKNRKF